MNLNRILKTDGKSNLAITFAAVTSKIMEQFKGNTFMDYLYNS